MGSSGGGVNYVPYDPSQKEAEFSAARTQIKDETAYRAYESALKANIYADTNIKMLNEGLGLISNVLKEQSKATGKEREQSANYLNRVGNDKVLAQATAKSVTDSLLSYINQANRSISGGS